MIYKNSIFLLCPNVALFLKNVFIFKDRTLLKNNIERTRISRWLGQENEENVARTRDWCGWPSSPRWGVGGWNIHIKEWKRNLKPYIKEHNIVSNYITLMARFIIMFNRWSLVLFECWTITSDVISHILKWGDCNKFVLFCLLISDVISRILKWGDCNKFVYFVYLYLTSSVVYWSREIAINLFILFTYVWRHQSYTEVGRLQKICLFCLLISDVISGIYRDG